MRDVGGHVAVVAGNHLHRDTLLAQFAQDLGRAFLRRIEEQQQAEEGHLRLVVTAVLRLRRQATLGYGERAKTGGPLVTHHRLQRRARGVVERHILAAPAQRRAYRENLGERALGDHPGGLGPGFGDDDRQPATQEVVRDLVELAHVTDGGSVLGSGSLDRGVERVGDARLERRVEEAGASDIVRRLPIAAERRVVGTQHVHAAEVLDGVEPPHDDPAGREVARARRQGHADDRGKHLGRQADRQRHCEQQRFGDRAAEQLVDRQHRQHDDDHDLQQHAPEVTNPARELGLRLGLTQLAGDPSELGVPARLGDQHRRRAAAHRRTHEQHVGALAHRRSLGQHAGGFFDRHRFPGERRLGHLAIARFQHQPVGRHQVACGKEDDVARHDRIRRDDRFGPFAPHRYAQRQLRAQRRHRLACAVFLREAQETAAGKDGQDDRRVEPIAQPHRDRRAEDQDQRERAEELTSAALPSIAHCAVTAASSPDGPLVA